MMGIDHGGLLERARGKEQTAAPRKGSSTKADADGPG